MPNPDAMLDTAIFYATQDSFLAESEGEAAVLLPPYERPETTPEYSQLNEIARKRKGTNDDRDLFNLLSLDG